MKLFKDFLLEDDFKICYDDLLKKLSSESWNYTKMTWTSLDVTRGITGSVLSSSVSQKVFDLLIEKFSKILDISSFEKIGMMYYVWQPYSGLALHDDHCFQMASTIYLNQDWHVDYGGIFLWKESKEDEIYKAIPPIKNMMILNDQLQDHMVTPISPLAPNLRTTIQVWFNNVD